MPSYDGIKTSYKLGDDLQVADTTSGATEIWPSLEFGDFTASGFDESPQISICVHQGSLFVSWCEERLAVPGPIDRFVYGPYVKRFDLATNSWIQLGDVEPALLAVDEDDRATWNAIPSPYALGTRFLPKLSRLVSDGTSLYCVYAIHETVAMHSTTLSPLKLTIRRWNGSAWELYGEIPAVGWNDHGESFGGGNTAAFFAISAAASAHDPGACYATLVQSGETGPFGGGDPILYRGVVGRFDGSSLAGDVRVIGTPRTDPLDGTGTTEFVSLAVLYDDADGPWIWSRLDGGGFSNENALIRWADMAVVQSWTNGVLPFVQQPTGYRQGAWLCSTLLAGTPFNFTAVRELASDGSTSASDELDGLPDLEFPIAKYLAEPPSRNIWVVGGEGQIFLYHLPCRAWTDLDFTFTPVASDPYSGLTPAFWFLAFRLEGGRNLVVRSALEGGSGLDSVLDDGVIYVAAWFTDTDTDTAKIRVYACPIQRNKYGCARTIDRGVELAPYWIPLGNEVAPV